MPFASDESGGLLAVESLLRHVLIALAIMVVFVIAAVAAGVLEAGCRRFVA